MMFGMIQPQVTVVLFQQWKRLLNSTVLSMVPNELYKTLEEAHASINGFNLTEAKAFNERSS